MSRKLFKQDERKTVLFGFISHVYPEKSLDGTFFNWVFRHPKALSGVLVWHLQWCFSCTGLSWWRRSLIKIEVEYVPIDLYCHHHLQWWALGSEQKNEITEASSKNEFPQQGGWVHLWVQSKELGYPEGVRSRAAAPSQLRSQLRSWCVSDASGFWAWWDNVWPPDELNEVTGVRHARKSLLDCCPHNSTLDEPWKDG